MPRRPIINDASSVSRNPHAEKLDAAKLKELVSSFYGTKVLLVDKGLAEALLEFNTANRTLNRRKVDRLVAQMQGGTFENTGEPVILSQEGVLNDGQHRLKALVEADVTVDMDVRFGIARKAFTKTNTGTARTSSDVLVIRGVSGGTAIAPAVRLLILYARGLPGSVREFVSNSEIHDAFHRWSGFEAVAKQVAARKFPPRRALDPAADDGLPSFAVVGCRPANGLAGDVGHWCGQRQERPSLHFARAPDGWRGCSSPAPGKVSWNGWH